jgi:hypothetical protein
MKLKDLSALPTMSFRIFYRAMDVASKSTPAAILMRFYNAKKEVYPSALTSTLP